jgi:prepilin-type N-terminal cleavage/methylation domain-containing protein/prepilin-type processing-associated H-X9-DG protein
MGFRFSKDQRGLTMIEMLVCVVAIVILAGLFFPAFRKARQGAQRTKCLSNLKQLGVAVGLYVQDDNQRRYPGWGGGCVDTRELPNVLWRYMGQENESALWSGELHAFECPSNQTTTDLGSRQYGGGSPELKGTVDYSINCNLWGQQSIAKIGNDSIAVVLYDYGVDSNLEMHAQGSNFLFADGHGQWIPENKWNSAWPGSPQYAGTKYNDWGIQ